MIEKLDIPFSRSSKRLELHAKQSSRFRPLSPYAFFPPPPHKLSNSTIFIAKPDIPRSLRIPLYKLLVPRRTLILGISRQHTLQTHGHALDVLDGTPAGGAEEIEADDAVGVDVRVDGDFAGRGCGGYKGDFGGFWNGLLMGLEEGKEKKGRDLPMGYLLEKRKRRR